MFSWQVFKQHFSITIYASIDIRVKHAFHLGYLYHNGMIDICGLREITRSFKIKFCHVISIKSSLILSWNRSKNFVQVARYNFVAEHISPN